LTISGRWEQLSAGAATHLPFGAGHKWMHTAEAGHMAWGTPVPHVFCFQSVKNLHFLTEKQK
jgi:hypothetical protein